jgi:hypothetical protein
MNWSVLKEESGKTSFSRVSSALVLAAWLIWVTYIVFTTKTLPGGMWEVSTVIASLYSLNKVTTSITGTKSDG